MRHVSSALGSSREFGLLLCRRRRRIRRGHRRSGRRVLPLSNHPIPVHGAAGRVDGPATSLHRHGLTLRIRRVRLLVQNGGFHAGRCPHAATEGRRTFQVLRKKKTTANKK